MLVSPKNVSINNSSRSEIWKFLKENSKELEVGIFLINFFNFELFLPGGTVKDKWPQFIETDEDLGAYGVCDTIEQVKERYAKWLNDPELKYCISITSIKKSEESSEGGWRWHKWGDYIGDKNPQHEYLYDEADDIQEVFVYHIYQLN